MVRPSCAIRPLAIMPVDASSEKAPALAPFATMTVIKKALILTLPATAIAIGAKSATAAILPGPMLAKSRAKPKKRKK